MGYNITGYATNFAVDTKEELEYITGCKLSNLEDESKAYEDAIYSFRDDDKIYVYSSERGAIILPNFGQLIQNPPSSGELIQFIISDVSDTYYFESFKDGALTRKLITTEGEIVEDVGKGFVHEGDYLLDKVWAYLEKTIGVDDMMGLNFKKYAII